jgi:hypothetical protein
MALSRLGSVLSFLAIFPVALVAMPSYADERRGEVIEKTAALMQERYLDETRGQELAQMLRNARASNRFASFSDPDEFAREVTGALRATVPDLHLKLTYEPDREFVPGVTRDESVRRIDDTGAARRVVRTGKLDGRTAEEIARTNFGVDRADLLDESIGYLKLSRFIPAALSRDAVRAAVDRIAHSSTVIVDLRGNIGGSPDAVAQLLSAFFAAERGPVELHVAENRAAHIRDAVMTDPALARATLAQAQLFVLIDAKTASAAEMFAYAAHRTGRAKLIGETTAGAGNGGMKYSVGSGFAVVVPEWRVLTGPGWEGGGVTPDVRVDSSQALEAARALAQDAG